MFINEKNQKEWVLKHSISSMGHSPKSRSKKVKAWDTQQVEIFKKHIQSKPYKQLYLLLLAIGMRIGEALGLEAKHIQKGSIRIEQQKRRLDRKIVPPKTLSSFHTITVPQAILDELPEELFTHLSYQQVWDDYTLICEETGLSNIGLHGFRHTHATLLVSKDIIIVLAKDSKRLRDYLLILSFF